ncbi:hypothetical protein B0T16DRAFT_444673 [Cercophora newfieldiana]|uniref:SRR1-like domain-containing protein n=1 Tax=Cercophora newfieldiana TaxID=92897 RepID=A0AA39Y9V1_9PEZI|nr:hypothetical protein B0T16DRAFT_444673 [Cercophora newfieldiana]
MVTCDIEPGFVIKRFSKENILGVVKEIEKYDKGRFPIKAYAVDGNDTAHLREVSSQPELNWLKEHWTDVSTVSGRPNTNPAVVASVSPLAKGNAGVSVARIIAEFDSSKRDFLLEDSRHAVASFQEQLRVLCDDAFKPEAKDNIKNIVGIALANASHKHCVSRHWSIDQHAVLLVIKELLGSPIPIFSQDPMYGDNARTALEMKGIQVLEDPHAIFKVDQGTFLVTMYANFPIKEIITDLTRPAFIVWLKTIGFLRAIGPNRDTESTRVTDMLRNEYKTWIFPHRDAMPNMYMYVRNDLSSDAGPLSKSTPTGTNRPPADGKFYPDHDDETFQSGCVLL